jgi:hypothetical protein
VNNTNAVYRLLYFFCDACECLFAIFCCRAASTGFYERSKTKNLSSPKTNALDFCFSVAVNWPIGSAKSNAIVKVVFLLVNDRVPVSLFIFLHTVQANRE